MGEFNLKNLSWEGYGYFLEQHNIEICAIIFQTRVPKGEQLDEETIVVIFVL